MKKTLEAPPASTHAGHVRQAGPIDVRPSTPKTRVSLGLCVAGMHRSGTSLVAAWLERCGLPVHTGRVLGAGIGNAAGHSEDRDFLEVDERAVERRFPASGGWRVTDDGRCHFLREERLAALEVVYRRTRHLDQWAWKDPRATLLLDAWAELVPNLRTLLVWRPCSEVVDSLLRRAQASTHPSVAIDEDTAVGMWIAYSRRVIDFRKRNPDQVLLIPIASFVRDARGTRALLKARLGLRLIDAPLDDVYDPDLLVKGASIDLGSRNDEVVAMERELAQLSDA